MAGAGRRAGGSVLEGVAAAAAGGALAGVTWSVLGIGWPAAAVGAANGAIGGGRWIYHWRNGRGLLAFTLDSTWALPLSAAAHQMFMMASTAGHGGEDDSAVIKIFPGIELPGKAE